MPAILTPQRAKLSGLNAHLPPFRHRVDSFDENTPERQVWPPHRPHMEFDDANYEQDDNVVPEPPTRYKRARHRPNLVIDTEDGVDGDASVDEGSDVETDDIDGFIVADDNKF